MHRKVTWKGKPIRRFGWQQDGVTPDPAEAALIRDAAEVLASGKAPGVVSRQWRAAGIRSERSGQWHPQPLEAVLRRPDNVPLIMSADLHERMVHALDDPDRLRRWKAESVRENPRRVANPKPPRVTKPARAAKPPRPPRPPHVPKPAQERQGNGRWLTTGVAVCGECGAPLRTSGSRPGFGTVICCNRSRHGAARDGQQHPTGSAQQIDAKIRLAAVTAWSATQQRPVEQVAAEFDALTLFRRREVATRLLEVALMPTAAGNVGRIKIQVRS